MTTPSAYNEDAEKEYMPSRWTIGLQGASRMQRFRHICNMQNEYAGTTSPVECVPFGTDERQALNVMRCPVQGGEDVVLVYVHGGFWIEGNRHNYNFVAVGAHREGVSAVIVGYRLASRAAELNNCIDDVRTGLATVQKMFPTSNIILVGHSAGAHLLLSALPRLNTLKGFSKIFAVSGIYSLRELMSTSVGVQLGLTVDQADKYSIAPHPSYSKVDIHFVAGQFDPPKFLLQARELAGQLQTVDGVNRPVRVLLNEDHFSLIENLFYSDGSLTKYIVQHIGQDTKRNS